MSKLAQLVEHLNTYSRLAIALSGGVDSMLLTYVAHRFSTAKVIAMHACSPAVPHSAYALLRKYAKEHGWDLRCLDAGELKDENYIANPRNRCYFCKSNLFQRIAMELAGIEASARDTAMDQTRIASGTNVDDLSDYRPGLQAAQEFSVVQPYVDVGICKADIYHMAAHLQLTNLQRLPAQPCLASRIETGIPVKREDLRFIDDVETLMKRYVGAHETLRCRITAAGLALEFNLLPSAEMLKSIEEEVQRKCKAHNIHYCGAKNYQKGSAFLLNP